MWIVFVVYPIQIFFPLTFQIQDLQKYQSLKKRNWHTKEFLEEVMDKHVLNSFEWNGDFHSMVSFFKSLNCLKGNRLFSERAESLGMLANAKFFYVSKILVNKLVP